MEGYRVSRRSRPRPYDRPVPVAVTLLPPTPRLPHPKTVPPPCPSTPSAPAHYSNSFPLPLRRPSPPPPPLVSYPPRGLHLQPSRRRLPPQARRRQPAPPRGRVRLLRMGVRRGLPARGAGGRHPPLLLPAAAVRAPARDGCPRVGALGLGARGHAVLRAEAGLGARGKARCGCGCDQGGEAAQGRAALRRRGWEGA